MMAVGRLNIDFLYMSSIKLHDLSFVNSWPNDCTNRLQIDFQDIYGHLKPKWAMVLSGTHISSVKCDWSDMMLSDMVLVCIEKIMYMQFNSTDGKLIIR